MAGRLRKTALYLGLVDDDEEEYFGDVDDEYTEPEERRPAARSTRPDRESITRVAPSNARRTDRAPVRAGHDEFDDVEVRRVAAPAAEAYRITTLTPRTYNEARTIGEHFRDGVPVIINLTEMDDADAKRLVDFCAGLIFGLHGSIERVTNKVFLLSPSNVTVSEADKVRIAEGGFFNQS